ncbi:chemotaxis protein CheB [Chitinophaga sp. MD30]|uniref:chemotaxis protein CheB n=1 Tax=Chitinophaga sp. MD30 TaxID=2033437 RepID=UPI000BAFC70D|nr:chemotaxis protein CheB [Chitinophaga sp. MD30]ASZ14206.1 chemotaxis protein [Chitinophaga sp. MD30]
MKRMQQHYVVALGASAGGLEAIQEFFDHMPRTANLSFVIIQHLSPDFKSLLVELVGRHTHMKVVEAAHQHPVAKNCIYVIPNNKLIRIQRNKLVLADKSAEKVPNNAIDVFLHSLAMDKKEKAIAVILSGTGTDGTKGIVTVKEQGGMVLVQEPRTAKFDGMPNSAIQSGYVDLVAPSSNLPSAILQYIQQIDRTIDEHINIDEKILTKVFDLIRQYAGQEFYYYKTPTVLRRISRRMIQGDFSDPKTYVEHLESNPEECKELARDFLINVTRFFRDPEAFDIIKEQVLREVIANKEPEEQIKIWVAACSTGEEAYSIAIAVDEMLEEMDHQREVKIFATDIEASNLEIAMTGTYPQGIERDVSEERRNKYFSRKGRTYTIIPRLRKQIVFARHDIIKDPPFIKNDLVSCRNMLIYMNAVLQERIYATLQFSVNKQGFLFLGPSENPTFLKGSMQQINAKWKIFRKLADGKARLYMGNSFTTPSKHTRETETVLTTTRNFESKSQRALWDDLRDTLTEDLGMLALYIDRNFEIRETLGNYDQLLSLPKKNLNLSLLRMLPPELSVIFNKEIRKAWKQQEKITLRNIIFGKDGHQQSIHVVINPDARKNEQEYTLVVISKNGAATVEKNIIATTAANNEEIDGDYLQSLEAELAEVRGNLQIAIEDLETANEELQSSNEELLSSNEELQSSNEELQSLNEELYTLNTEHQLKIKELVELNDDLNNYFRSTDIAQIFLDEQLNIRKFNPASVRMINFIESDLGRPITHISNNIRYDHLVQDIEQVQRSRSVIEKEVQQYQGQNLLMRIMPYLTKNGRSSGVIITFVDISTITNLNNIIRSVFNASRGAIIAMRPLTEDNGRIQDFLIITGNKAMQDIFVEGEYPLAGKTLRNTVPLLATPELLEEYYAVIKENEPINKDIYIAEKNSWFELIAVRMPDGLVATFTDITDKKNADQRIRKSYSELNEVKENLKKLNAELENIVRNRTRELSFSEERFRLVARATNDTLWDWDLANNTVWWSDSFAKMFGYHQQDISRNEWAERLHPGDRRQVLDSIHAAINDSNHQWSREYRWRKADGVYANILDRGYILHNEFGVPYRMLGSMLDLTALKQAEKAIASNIAEKKFLAESMPLIVWTANEEGNVDFVNRQFEYYTGMQHDEALGTGWQQTIHPGDLPLLLRTWKAAAQSQQDFNCDIRMRISSRDYRWNRLSAKARKDDKGHLISWVITNLDVHDQRVMNAVLEEKVEERTRQLQQTNRELESSNYDLQLFASVASHDLQEPLRKIHMFSKMVKDRHAKDLSEDALVYLHKIMQSANRMKSLVINILDFSKLSAAHAGGFEKTDIAEVLQEVCEDFEVIIKEKKATFVVENIPQISANRSQIKQVFQNLIANSLKFTRTDTEPVIHIRAWRVSAPSFDAPQTPNGDWCCITIHDNGIGFDDQFKTKIFDLFQRLNSKDKFEGTGIGLAIIKKIVEKHNGSITAESKEGEGATFKILLPLEQDSENK